MSEVLQRRQSIHPDEQCGLDKQTDQKLLQCETCSQRFLTSGDGSEVVLDENEAKNFANLEKKKKDVDIDFENLSVFKCKGCKPQQVTSPPRLFLQKLIIWPLIVLIVVSLIYMNYEYIAFYFIRGKNIPVKEEVTTNADIMLEEELDKLEQSYSNQIEDTWIILSSGIKSVVREDPYMPSMFLLLFDSESAGETAQCIARDVSKPAIKYLLKKTVTPLIIKGADLNEKRFLDDPGVLLPLLNNTVREKGALIVTNLHEVPPIVAKMFHFVCDRYSPLVEKAVTFFTLKVNQMPSIKDQQKTVEETMRELWSSVLDDNVLRPLITRMTSNIIRIKPDSNCYMPFDSL